MNCPICNAATRVINSRPEDDRIHRRRECQICGHRFSTVELEGVHIGPSKRALRAKVDALIDMLQRGLYMLLDLDK